MEAYDMPIYDKTRMYTTGGHLSYHIQGELEFILEYAKSCGGPILDLACCAGRVTSYLAEHGFSVVGLDASAAALERAAKERASLPADVQSRMKYVQGDMFRFHFREPFPLIIIPYHSFWYNADERHREADAERCLECIMESLVPGGTFLIDRPLRTFGPNDPWWARVSHELRFDYSIKPYLAKSHQYYDMLGDSFLMLVGTKRH